jgi:hypothetical protein
MKKLLIPILILCVTLLSAQENLQRHSLSFTGGGPANIFTLEYDYYFIKNEKWSTSLNIGAGGFFADYKFPIGINFVIGKQHQFLCGFHYLPTLIDNLWADIVSEDDWSLFHWASPRIGYREQMKIWKLNIFAQIYFSPVFQFEYDRIIPWGGLGIGINF